MITQEEVMTRELELSKDILKVGGFIARTTNPKKIEALQKLIVILESWK
jgi:hypothetical protein